jgi:hypothetical protein
LPRLHLHGLDQLLIVLHHVAEERMQGIPRHEEAERRVVALLDPQNDLGLAAVRVDKLGSVEHDLMVLLGGRLQGEGESGKGGVNAPDLGWGFLRDLKG